MKTRIPSYKFENVGTNENLVKLLLWDRIGSYNYSEPHSHEFHEILFFLKGGGTHEISSMLNEINNYEIHILPANFTHTLNRKIESRGFTIAFSDSYFKQLLSFETDRSIQNLLLEPLIIKCTKEIYMKNKYLLNEILNENENYQIFYNIVALVLIKIFQFSKQQAFAKTIVNNEFTKSFSLLINENYKKHKQIEFYLSRLGKCKTTLNNDLHKYYGRGFKVLLNEKIMNEAKRMLRNSSVNVTEIAYELGFCDVASFSHSFNKTFGISPKKFMKCGQINK
jgi:AraC family transcriptional regulator, transcriptional activator of pobA